MYCVYGQGEGGGERGTGGQGNVSQSELWMVCETVRCDGLGCESDDNKQPTPSGGRTHICLPGERG